MSGTYRGCMGHGSAYISITQIQDGIGQVGLSAVQRAAATFGTASCTYLGIWNSMTPQLFLGQ